VTGGSGVETFGIPLLLAGLTGMAAVMSNRLSERLNVPAPAFFLVCAAIASDLWTRLGGTPASDVEDVVTVALVIVLFDGGMQIGLDNFITEIGATLWLGVVGTVLQIKLPAALSPDRDAFLFGVVFLVLVLRLWSLQIIDGKSYAAAVTRNQVRVVSACGLDKALRRQRVHHALRIVDVHLTTIGLDMQLARRAHGT